MMLLQLLVSNLVHPLQSILEYALQWMYEVANEIDEEKEALKGNLASNDAELLETLEEVSRVCHEEQLLRNSCSS